MLIAKVCALLVIWHVWFAEGASDARGHVDTAARIAPVAAPAAPTPLRHAGP